MSVPGVSERSLSRPDSGFTLLEMLVVVMIMGMLLGLVATISAPDQRATLALEAERLAQLLDLAATESRFAGQPIAWTADGSGYRFWRLGVGGLWAEISDNDLLRPRSLPSGVSVESLRVESGKPREKMRLEFGAATLAPPFEVELAMGPERFRVTGSPVGEVLAVRGKD